MASPLSGACGTPWHLGWHGDGTPLHGCAPVPTHRSGGPCSFLLGKLRQGRTVCGSVAQPGLAQLWGGHSAQCRMVALQAAICI